MCDGTRKPTVEERRRQKWMGDFEQLTSAEQHGVTCTWERRAKERGIRLPPTSGRVLVLYAWEVRSLVREHDRAEASS
jgi:hypothetical protein